jgi:glycosyltransferase involved in cell wall biosynthesis
MNNIKISIIVAVYNGQETISQCIHSILNSNLRNLEIIIVNDGSKDHTSAIINSLSKEDNRIHIIEQSNQGVSAARNNGLAKATGEWVLFMDADDWLHSQNFMELVSALKHVKNNINICTFGFTTILKEKSIVHNETNSQTDAKTILNSAKFKLASWNYIFRRAILIKNQILFPVGIICSEDQNFNLKALCYTSKVQAFAYQIYYYNCCNTTSASKTKHNSNWIKSRLLSANDLLEFCIAQNRQTEFVLNQVKRMYEAYINDFSSNISPKEKRLFYRQEYAKTITMLPAFKNIKKLALANQCMWVVSIMFQIHKFWTAIK